MSDLSEEEANAKSQRDLRQRRKIDYKKMHTGETRSTNEELLGGATGGQDDHNTELTDMQPASTSFDPEAIDAEMSKMEEELKQLQEEEEMLRKSQSLRNMRQELAEKKKAVQKLRGKNTTIDSPVDIVKPKTSAWSMPEIARSSINHQFDIRSVNDNEVTVQSLRKDNELKRLVRKELSKLGLKSEDSSEDSSSSSSSSSDSSEEDIYTSECSLRQQKKKKKKKHHKKKSGINAKSSDKVKFPQKWPHAHLQFEFVNKQVKFDELDFKLFIAGELEIISGERLPNAEKSGRINLLKKIIYYSSSYEFKGLKAFYAAWLREIELGKKTWSDDSQQIESAILSKYLRLQKGLPNKNSKDFSKQSEKKNKSTEEKTWFCSPYQRNKCQHKGNHLVVIKGEQRLALHICATCWQKDKIQLSHPECSTSCPHASA